MDRINGADWIDIGGGRRGFKDLNLAGGVAGTEVTALWLSMVQEEILAVVEAAGMAASDADWSQLLKAIRIAAGAANGAFLAVGAIVTAPPGAPASGDRYIIPAGATGAWAGHSQKLAQWTGTTWIMTSTPNGHAVGLPDGRIFSKRAGTYTEVAATDTFKGLVELATPAEAQAGVDTERAVTPAGLTSGRRRGDFVLAAGTANALTGDLAPAPADYAVGMTVLVRVGTNNTGAATINLNGLGDRQLRSAQNSQLAAGALVTDEYVLIIYNGASFLVIGGSATTQNRGMLKLATDADVQTGTDTERAVTPAGLSSRSATTVRTGLVELATTTETVTGADNERAVTPAGLAALTATLTRSGLVELATVAEGKTGTDDTRAATPASVTAAIRSATVPLATGNANVLNVAVSPPVTEYTAGLSILVRIATTNTGPATLNVDGQGALEIRTSVGGQLAAGALIAGDYVRFTHNSAIWIAETNAANAANRGMAKRAVNGKDPTNFTDFLTPGLQYDAAATWFSMRDPSIAVPDATETSVTGFTAVGANLVDSTISYVNGVIAIGAEDAGLWCFDAQFLTVRSDVTRAIGYLYSNDVSIAAQQDVSDNGFARRISVSKIVRLAAGDTVRPRVFVDVPSGTTTFSALSSFSGFRIAG